jgi:hypothetical protein
MLKSEKHPNLQGLFIFAFRCDIDARELSNVNPGVFRSEAIYRIGAEEE